MLKAAECCVKVVSLRRVERKPFEHAEIGLKRSLN